MLDVGDDDTLVNILMVVLSFVSLGVLYLIRRAAGKAIGRECPECGARNFSAIREEQVGYQSGSRFRDAEVEVRVHRVCPNCGHSYGSYTKKESPY